MSKRHRRTCIGTQGKSLPCLVLSYDQLKFLKQTVAALEQVIGRQTKPFPNLDFARDTVFELQAKIDTMLNAEMWGKVVEMNANEMLMLQISVWIFTAALDAIPDLKEKANLKKQCESIGLFLAPFSQQIFQSGAEKWKMN